MFWFLQEVSHVREVWCTLCACLGSFTFGAAIGYTSPTIPQLQQEGYITTSHQASWFGALITLGEGSGLVESD